MEVIIPSTKEYVIMDSQLLGKLMKCPRDFHYTFNLNKRPDIGKSNAFECGGLVHFILEHFYKSIIGGHNRSAAISRGFDAGKEFLKPYDPSNIYQLDKSYMGLQNTEELSSNKPKRTGWKHVFHTMEEYFDYWRSENWTPIEVENVRRHIIYEDDELSIMWKAKFDLIEDSHIGFISTDHKTMSQVRDTVSLNNQFIGQCVLLNQRRIQINKIGFQTSLKPEEKFLRPLITYSADRIAEWRFETVPYYARQLLAYYKAQYYPQNFHSCEDKYGYCMFKNVCEHDRNMREKMLELEFKTVEPWDVNNEQ